ncbi:MAG: hypothetical protein SFX18_16145 [Pirellulales bacterium]|nr:hypothetical protein [Pirellulales bacterium]
MSTIRYTLVLSLFFAFNLQLLADNYQESTDGDLSGNLMVPTLFELDVGQNRISATSASGDLEYFRVVVPANSLLSVINHDIYQSNNARAFLGMQFGPTFTVLPNAALPADLAGYTHFGFDTISSNLMLDMSTSFGSQGFSVPLGPGDYTFWAQQLESQPTFYQFTFEVQQIPEPAFGVWVALCVIGMIGRLSLSLLRGQA